jgi:hypothetical protein
VRPAAEARPANEVLLAGLRRSGAQQMASDGDSAVRQLVLLAEELGAAEREMCAAQSRERALANRPGPRWYRRSARGRREDELRGARRETVEAAERVERLREHRAELQRAAAVERGVARETSGRRTTGRERTVGRRERDFGVER